MTENHNQKIELFNSIYDAHRDILLKYILVSLHHDKELANDCLQDTALLALQKIDTLITHPNPGGFLIVTAQNNIKKCRTLQNKNQKRLIPLDDAVNRAVYEEDFDRLFTEQINIDVLKQNIISKFDENEMILYELFYEKKASIKTISQKLMITEGNVKVRLFRLRLKVKKMVADIWPK